MPSKLIQLWSMPDDVMLVIEHASGVVYQNQVGGNACWQAVLEGVLAPLDIGADGVERIMNLFDPFGAQGISIVTADAIDGILASESGAKGLSVNRERLDESWEAWIHVIVDSPTSADTDAPSSFLGSWYGFGKVRGVLTWPSSD